MTVASTRSSSGVRAAGALLFASSNDESRARRPTDVALAIVSVTGLIFVPVTAAHGADLDAALSEVLTAFPPFLDPLWRGLVWAALGWGLVLLVAAVLRRRLARDVVAAVVLVLVLGIVLSAVVTGSRWDVVSRLAYIGLPPVYPSGVVVVAACLAVTSPHVARPFRELGCWLPTGQLAGWCSSAARRWPVASPRSRRPGRR